MTHDRIEMQGADGVALGWTYDAEQYELVSEQILVAIDALAGPDGFTSLRDTVRFVQDHLEGHPKFPSGRFTNATRYVAADLEGRGLLERGTPDNPRRLRRV